MAKVNYSFQKRQKELAKKKKKEEKKKLKLERQKNAAESAVEETEDLPPQEDEQL
ncbi:hypothetical protein [Desulfobacula sp.]|uniref:hypothetical protein n=1 Tax=Desulfobacula sp. TaxID=2593537 RepID=UPI00262D48FA|nr:hypothetical protein [Desulfobacula sp.]